MTEADVPTYQYACTACGHQLEAVQKFSDEALTECPDCAGRLRKLFSSVGVVFKGSGFYRTDSRAKEPSAASTTPAKGETTKTESSTSTPSTPSTSTSTSTTTASSSTAA
jgi:putative FmdB family regulatory protein